MTTAFHLAVQPDGLATLTFDLPDKKVNVFTRTALAELDDVIRRASQQEIKCLVLLSGKKGNFVAGADLDEIAGVTDPAEAEAGARLGQKLFSAWSALPFPTIAAIQGTCLGGGTELSLASDYILVSDRQDLRIGLPETRIGIVPAWGGCARLPRRIGIAAALDIILAGKAVPGKKAYRLGLADRLLPDAAFLTQVRKFAELVLEGGKPRSRAVDLKEMLLEKNPVGRMILFDQARKKVLERTGSHYPAPIRAIEVVKVGVERGLEAGLEAEARATGELAISPVCKNLVHLFRLVEASKRNGDTPPGKTGPISSVAVLGAGVMGGGIAQLIALRTDAPVRLKDLAPEPLASGMAHAAGLFRKLVKRRRLSRVEAKQKMSLLLPTLSYRGFERAKLVIEAIVEDLAIKQKVFSEVAANTSAETILASNTSSLSIDLIGRETPHRERVVGMHFFNPVHKMPLVEVIAGPDTAPEVVGAVADFSRRLGKTTVVVKDGPGFLVNRLLTFYMTEAMWLLDEGHRIEEIDQAMTDWGMPMGPMALADEVGLDVAAKVSHILGEAFGDRLPHPGWLDRLPGTDRLGAKTGAGFYLYQKGKRTEPDSEVYGRLGLTPDAVALEPSKVVERMVLPMVNEAGRCLEEEVVGSAGKLDLAMIMGVGFPPFRGGLCRWADQQGLGGLVEIMTELAKEVGERFEPSTAVTAAAKGGGFYEYFG
ncbi:MAG: fatty acid oxidation complex subunit alpha FadJ [Acidobacteria bacterium]|nr:MAG: fatty acid oxidation complex subunit alpha FadJ [Acidobacteriota bacterium]